MDSYYATRAALLGDFDLVSKMRVFPAAHEGAEAVSYTDIHENSHRKLASSTTFGQVQYLLADVLKNGSAIPWRSEAEAALHDVLDASFYVDEGFATFCEFSAYERYRFSSPPQGVPRNYKRALQLLTTGIRLLPANLLGFEWYMVRALAEAAMNSRILITAPFDEHFCANVRRAMTCAEYRPDDRLLEINAKLSEQPFPESLGESIERAVFKSASEHGLREAGSASQLCTLASTHASERNNNFARDVDNSITPLIEEALRLILGKDGFLRSGAVFEARTKHLEAAQAFAVRFDFVLPSYSIGSEAETALALTEIDYLSGSIPETIHFTREAADKVLKMLVTDHDAFFINVCADVPTHAGRWSLAILPLLQNGKSIEEGFHFQDLRVCLYGDYEDVRRWLVALNAKPTTLVTDFPAIDHETWTLRPEVQELGLEQLVVLRETRGSRIVALLEVIMTSTEVRDLVLMPSSPPVVYFLLVISTGLKVILPMPAALPGIIRVHFPHLSSLFKGDSHTRLTRYMDVVAASSIVVAVNAGLLAPYEIGDAMAV